MEPRLRDLMGAVCLVVVLVTLVGIAVAAAAPAS